MNNYNRNPGDNMVMPQLPTGAPTGPLYSPYPVSPDNLHLRTPLTEPPMMPVMPPMPALPQPAECPFPMDVNSGMGGAFPQTGTAPMTGLMPSTGIMPGTMPGIMPSTGTMPSTGAGGIAPLPGSFPSGEQPPITTMNPMYTPGYLRTQIGKTVRVEFLIGTSSLTDRLGTLVGVGTSYILLREVQSDDIILCDIYSIKFVTFYL